MPTTFVYEKILSELAAGELGRLARKVFDLLQIHPDGLTRYQLIAEIYSQQAAYNARAGGLANSSQDRKIRKAVEALREIGICVVSSSGEAGYRLDASPEAAQAMAKECRSRSARLTAHAERLETLYGLTPPPSLPQDFPATQPRLM